VNDQIKVMYFGPIPERTSCAEFRQRWRQHARHAMAMPFWRFINRYQHFDALAPGERGISEELYAAVNADRKCGGVGCTWYPDREALDANLELYDELQPLLEDEEETFGRQLGSDVVPVVENRVIDRGPATLTLLSGLWAKPDVGRASFSQQWRDMAASLSEYGGVERHLVTYVQNHSLEGFEGRDGLAEYGFASAEALSAFLAEPKLADWLASGQTDLVVSTRKQTIIGAEHTLFDCP